MTAASKDNYSPHVVVYYFMTCELPAAPVAVRQPGAHCVLCEGQLSLRPCLRSFAVALTCLPPFHLAALIFDVFIQVLAQDGTLAIASIGMVFTYIWVTTGSGFLAFVGMSEIVLSLPVAWFFLRAILQIKYFAGLNIMCIFIVCAIGADDIFVFMDAYVQSQFKGTVVNRDMETRFSWVYRKSGLAMAITSLTTCSAFLCCLSTPLVDTQGFGLFAAAVIAADYIFVMTMFCTAVMVYHNRFEKPPACSCTLPTCMGPCTCGCCLENCDCSASDPTPTQKAFAASTGEDSRPRDSIEKFFRETFAPLILDPKARIAIAVVLVGWLIPAVIFVFLLTPTTEPEQFLNPNHPFQKAINVLNNNFGTNSQDPGIDLIYTWGLKDVNRDGVNLLTNASFMGKAQYEENFKFNTKCQDAIRKVCEDLKIKNTTDDYLGMIQRNKKAEGSIKCFVHADVPKYFDDPDVEATDNNAASGLKWTNVGGTEPTGTEMPVNDKKPAHQKLAKALEGKTEFTVAEWLAFGAIDLRMGHFIKAGDNYFKPADAADRDKPETWLPGFMQMRVPDKDDEDTTSMVSISQFYGNEYMGWDGKEVKFVSISVEAKEITRFDRPGEEWMRERYKKYDDLRHNLNHIAQEACGSEVFMTEMNEKFIFMNNQMIYRTSAIRGALIGVAIAFAVLLLCTWSPLLAVCATLSILCTMMSGKELPPSCLKSETRVLLVFPILARGAYLAVADQVCLRAVCSHRTHHDGRLGPRHGGGDPHLDPGGLFGRLRGASCARLLAQLRHHQRAHRRHLL